MLLVVLVAFVVGLDLYFPALNGQFVFDDFALPYRTGISRAVTAWLSGVRPVLMLTYWFNDAISGDSTFSYHFLNLLIHITNTCLVFLALNRLLALPERMSLRTRRVAAGIGAAVFLVHPLQTESVSYIAGRSESLAAMFVLLAYLVFLYRRREAISWLEVIALMIFFALGVGTKENAASLAGVLVLTDVFWPRAFSTRSLRNNWRLYVAMIPGAAIAAWRVFQVLAGSHSAGLSLQNLTWYQYGFTEARAIFTYVRLAVVPFGQSVDHDYAVSHTILEHGAIFYLAALVALTVLCFVWRNRYPLACFGWLLTLVLLAPTSSIIPILDPLVERRMYLPLVGLILIGCEVASHIRISHGAGYTLCAGMLIFFALLCYQRNQLWGQPAVLWAEAAISSTGKGRPYENLVTQLVHENRCALAIPYLQRAEQALPNDYEVELGWGQILECLGRRDQALFRLRRAARIKPCSQVYRLLGLLYGEMGKRDEAGRALHAAVDFDPSSAPAGDALALWYEWTQNLPAAEQEYRRILLSSPSDRDAEMGLTRVRAAQQQRLK
jgi:Flp pilus assembly protein TadD